MLTEDQWFERLKTWVPQWFLADQLRNVAILRAIAKTIAESGIETEDLVSRTYIMEAYQSWLDLHGNERATARISEEEDTDYSPRIVSQSLVSRCDIASIKAVVDQLLSIGPCEIREDFKDGPFFNRGFYYNRNAIFIQNILNAFTIIVPKQRHTPYEFYSRSVYANREGYVGTISQVDSVFDSIIVAVNALKAFGVLYRIIELETAS